MVVHYAGYDTAKASAAGKVSPEREAS
jgi:hypothetical protein